MLGDQLATFERSGATGRALLRAGDEAVLLHNPWNPFTHISMSRTKTWTAKMNAHEVSVAKEREQFFAGLRDAHFVVHVDGVDVASGTGY